MNARIFLVILISTLCACDMSKDLNVKSLKGYEFSLTDVQVYCTVKREGDRFMKVNCEKPRLRPVEISCEGQMSEGLADPKFYCTGGLWILNEACYIEMTGTHTGNIKCRKN